MIILYNDRPNRHLSSWNRHRKASFSTLGALRSTLLSIAERLKKLAFRTLLGSVTVLLTLFRHQGVMN